MKARELLADPKRWTTGTMARDSAGKACGTAEGVGAVAWNISGAIYECYRHTAKNEPTARERHREVRKVIEARHDMTISRFNDNEGHEAVLELLLELDV